MSDNGEPINEYIRAITTGLEGKSYIDDWEKRQAANQQAEFARQAAAQASKMLDPLSDAAADPMTKAVINAMKVQAQSQNPLLTHKLPEGLNSLYGHLQTQVNPTNTIKNMRSPEMQAYMQTLSPLDQGKLIKDVMLRPSIVLGQQDKLAGNVRLMDRRDGSPILVGPDQSIKDVVTSNPDAVYDPRPIEKPVLPKLSEGQKKQVIGVKNTLDGLDVFKGQMNDIYDKGITDGNIGDLINAYSTYNNLITQAKEVYALGALAGPDEHILKGIVNNPFSIMGLINDRESANKQLDELSRIMKNVGKTAVMSDEQIKAMAAGDFETGATTIPETGSQGESRTLPNGSVQIFDNGRWNDVVDGLNGAPMQGSQSVAPSPQGEIATDVPSTPQTAPYSIKKELPKKKVLVAVAKQKSTGKYVKIYSDKSQEYAQPGEYPK